MSIGVSVKIEGLPKALDKLNKLGSIDFHYLLDSLARMGQQQTQRRLDAEKTSPDGVPWKPRWDGRGALFVTGALARSVDHLTTATTAIWGVPREPVQGRPYALIHQFGGTITPKNANALHFHLGAKSVFAKKVTIPARPYLGVSAANAAEMEAGTAAFIEGELAK